MFTLSSNKDQRKNSLSRSLSVNEPLEPQAPEAEASVIQQGNQEQQLLLNQLSLLTAVQY